MIGFLLLFPGFISLFCNVGLTRANNRDVAVIMTDFKHGQDENIVALADFGVRANSFENASAAVTKAIAFCKTKKNVTLVLPGGRIDLWTEGSEKRELYISNSTEDDSLPKVKHIAFLMDGFKDFTIEGNNTLVVLHGKMVSFAILNSENIHIKNLQFDYERPTMSELSIVSASSQSIEAAVHPDSKYWIDNGKLTWYGEGWKNNSSHAIVFKPGDETMHYSSFKPFAAGSVVETSPGHLTFTGDFSQLQFEPGDVLTVRDPYRDNCGAFIHLSKNI
ncbi:MAG TPA: hypothetical protein VFV68_11895, partial [Agriterribacter sp.]|nr:hypothetical protein [Agriterribacter sp.]